MSTLTERIVNHVRSIQEIKQNIAAADDINSVARYGLEAILDELALSIVNMVEEVNALAERIDDVEDEIATQVAAHEEWYHSEEVEEDDLLLADNAAAN